MGCIPAGGLGNPGGEIERQHLFAEITTSIEHHPHPAPPRPAPRPAPHHCPGTKGRPEYKHEGGKWKTSHFLFGCGQGFSVWGVLDVRAGGWCSLFSRTPSNLPRWQECPHCCSKSAAIFRSLSLAHHT